MKKIINDKYIVYTEIFDRKDLSVLILIVGNSISKLPREISIFKTGNMSK